MGSGSNHIPVSQFTDSLHQYVTAEALAAPARPGTAGRFDRFEIVRPLGRGGMGVVLLALDPASPTPVALKLLRAELTGNALAVQRFLAEARHMRFLVHPGIVRILEVGENAATPWFAMPFFERGCLANLLRAGRTFSREQALSIARRVAGALEHAHRHGIIHRDLKPANILLGADGEACVTDFGLARTVFNDGVAHPERGHGEGTAPYMSPAVARGEAEDTRCDIYSFGAVLYEMLTGRAPYRGPDPAAILAQVLAGPPPPIRTLNPKADERMIQVVEDAMARELRDRYAHITDLVVDLERIAGGRAPVGARAVRLGPTLRRAVLSRRVLASAVGMACMALLAAGTWARLASRPQITLSRTIAPPQVTSWQGGLVANRDGDGLPDFIIPETAGIKVVSGLGVVLPAGGFLLGEPRTSAEVSAHWVVDADQDGFDEVFTCWANGATAVLAPLNVVGLALKRFTAPSTTHVDEEWGADWTRLHARVLADLDGDGRRELLVSTGWSRRSELRALICYDYESQTQRWRQAVAPTITSISTADLDGDGCQEILVGTYAPSNHHHLPDGTDDSHSYLYAFSVVGELLWRIEGGGVCSNTKPVLATTPGSGVTVYALSHSLGHLREEGDREFGRLLRLDSDGAITARWESRRGTLDGLAVDLNADGAAELLVTELSGRLLLLDAGLKSRREVTLLPDKYDGVHIHIVGVTNLTAAEDVHVVVTAWQSETPNKVVGKSRREIGSTFQHEARVVVLNRRLRPIAETLLARRQNYVEPGAVRLCDTDADGLPEIIVLSDALRVFKFVTGF